MSNGLQAPWVGLCKEDYRQGYREFIGYCSDCGTELYDDDETHEGHDGILCEECYVDNHQETGG